MNNTGSQKCSALPVSCVVISYGKELSVEYTQSNTTI